MCIASVLEHSAPVAGWRAFQLEIEHTVQVYEGNFLRGLSLAAHMCPGFLGSGAGFA